MSDERDWAQLRALGEKQAAETPAIEVAETQRADGRGIDLQCGIFYAAVNLNGASYVGVEEQLTNFPTGSLFWETPEHLERMLALLTRARAIMQGGA